MNINKYPNLPKSNTVTGSKDATDHVLPLNVVNDTKWDVDWRDESKDNMKDGTQITP